MRNRRTYEIISKWIGKHTGIKIEFVPTGAPCADVKNKLIQIPIDIMDEHAFAAIAGVIHEACHIRYTPESLSKIPKTVGEKLALNSIEDIRIDLKAQQILPNVKGFYEELYKMGSELDSGNLPFAIRVLCNLVTDMEGFDKYSIKDQKVKDFINKHYLRDLARKIMDSVDNGYDSDTKRYLDELCKILKFDKDPEMSKPIPKPDTGEGEGTLGELEEQMDKALKNTDKVFKGCGKGSVQNSSFEAIGSLALQEQTKKNFVELLNIKEVRKVYESAGQLDIDHLTDFLVGDIDMLFSEPKVEKKKKSKVVFLLDSSGSMTSQLPYDSSNDAKWMVLTKACKSLVEILEGIKETEGINVDWAVDCFDSNHHKLDRDRWERQYQSHVGGGTDLFKAFKGALDNLAKDEEIDGNRLMIVLTDGEVDKTQVNGVKKELSRANLDVRALIIGVGSDPHDEFSSILSCGHDIITEDTADITLMEAIMMLLE